MEPFRPSIKTRSFNLSSPSVIFLIAVNLIPIYGVLFLSWKVFSVIFLYWFENIIVGVFNIGRMFFAGVKDPKENIAKLFLIPFFCLHYGIFTAVHGVFVIFLFGLPEFAGKAPNTQLVLSLIKEQRIGEAMFFIFLSHAFSFFWNYLKKGEFRRANLALLMMQPYKRIVLLHLTILFGGFLLMALGSPLIGLCLFIFLKIFMDVKAHIKEHRKLSPAQEKRNNTILEEPWEVKNEA